MREKVPLLLVLLNLGVFAAVIAVIPIYLSRQVPHLAGYKDTRLVDSDLDASYSASLCRFTVVQQQTLETTKSEGDIWQRLPESWEGRGRIVGHGDEAVYRPQEGAPLRVVSRVALATRRPLNGLFVRNRYSFDVPSPLCTVAPAVDGR